PIHLLPPSLSPLLPPPPTSTLFPYTTLFRSLLTTTGRQPRWRATCSASLSSFIRSCWIEMVKVGIGRPSALTISIQHERMNEERDRKSTRLNSSHVKISYAVFCLKKKKTKTQ